MSSINTGNIYVKYAGVPGNETKLGLPGASIHHIRDKPENINCTMDIAGTMVCSLIKIKRKIIKMEYENEEKNVFIFLPVSFVHNYSRFLC
jgi:hypothetical protein